MRSAAGSAGQVLSTLGGFLLVALIVAACVQLSPLRQEVHDAPPPPADPALAAALAARARRDTARALAVEVCELDREAADTIVTARDECGGFLTIDDVLTLADVPVHTWETVRDRGVVVPR